jgi:phenylalanine 2-monooxygenase
LIIFFVRNSSKIADTALDALVPVRTNNFPPAFTSPEPTQKFLPEAGSTKAQIQADWEVFIKDHDGTTLEAAVRFILTTAQQNGRLPAITGLTGHQLLDWCVELFGRFGFGTGGFKPLYNISLVEMMRLVLWDYSNEYTFPPNLAPGNVDFIARLHDIAVSPPPISG